MPPKRADRIRRALAVLEDALVDDEPVTSDSLDWVRFVDARKLVDERRLERLIAAKILDCAKPGKHRLLRRSQLEAWIASHVSAPKAANDEQFDQELLRAGGSR